MASSKQRDIMDSNPRTGNDNKLPKLSDVFNMVKLGTDFKQLRILAGFGSYATHWIPIKGSKSGKETKIPRVCLNYNSETDSNEDNGCPYCSVGNKAPTKYLFNVIDRDEQEDLGKKDPKYSKEEIKSKFLEPNSKSRSPVYVLQLPPGQVDRLKKYAKLNKVKDKKKGNFSASVADPQHGIDLNISYDAEAKGNNYDIQKSERTPLNERELALLSWDIESISKLFAPMSLSEAKTDFKELKKIMTEVVKDNDYEDDDSKKKSKKGKKEESESELSSEESESESEAPKKKKSKKGKKEESESEDLSSESDLDFEGESESYSDVPKKKSKKGKKEESESEDSSEASESESESEAPKKKKSKKEESESEDSSEESESDSDVPKKKSKKSKKEESESELSSEESESESEAPKKKKRK